MRWFAPLVFWLYACVAVAADSAQQLEAVALFKGQAMLSLNGQQFLLRVGETSPDGVTLLEADQKGASVRYQGQVIELSLSRRITTRFAEPESLSLSITADASGHYRTRGAINDAYLDFLVDTGATVVVLSEQAAVRLNLDYLSGVEGYVETAQGVTNAYFLTLDKVTVGSLSVRQVRAAVVEGGFPRTALLGMSFLNQVDMRNRDGVLTLTR